MKYSKILITKNPSYIGTSKQKTESLTERMCGWSPKTWTNGLIGRTLATPETMVRFHLGHFERACGCDV